MKIYVAGKFEKKEVILDIYKKIQSMGHSVAYDWTTHKNIKPYAQNSQIASCYSSNEIAGISDCDVFIYLSDDKGHTLHMEFGAAMALAKKTGKPLIFAVGEHNDKSPWFFNTLVRRMNSADEVLEELRKM
jgi:hypothetical protein